MISINKSCRAVSALTQRQVRRTFKRLSYKVSAPLATTANPFSSGLHVWSPALSTGKRFLSSSNDITHNISFATIADMQRQVCELYPNRNSFGTRKGDVYEWMKYSEFGRKVQLCRYKLFS